MHSQMGHMEMVKGTEVMKKIKSSYFLLVSLLVIVLASMSLSLVACHKDEVQPVVTGPEAGVYYYDAGADEYTVVLGEGTQFSLAIADATIAGKYDLNGEVLTLKSNKSEEGQISAILKDDVITLTFDDAEFRFLKKKNFSVTFDSNEGSTVQSATVLNGKTVAKPNDPSREGYIFVGWYEDSEFKTPFAFNSHIITADTTVFARWVEKQIGGREYIVEFDAHNGGNNPGSITTIGGKVFALPVVEREGYTFKGWWYSMSGDATLSYEFVEGMSLDASSTLHAVWQANDLGSKLAEPLVNVDANSVKWTSVGAREYLLEVQGPDGNYIVNKPLGGTVESINFADYPAGDYLITVTAVANSGEENNSVTTRLYRNKALARVSQFSVIEPSVLLFNAVEHADKYLISVDCGDKNHNHVNFDNGLSTHFNFADCMMQNSGIKFTVTAVANGYASSVSSQFVYAPVLDAVTEFHFDAQTQQLVWNDVENATGYMVSVECNEEDVDLAAGLIGKEFVNVGAVNSLSLKEYAKGEIVVKVYPVSKQYISPEAATYTFNKQNLATPSNIRIQGTTISWDEVNGATGYEVKIAGTTVSANTNSVDLAGKVNLVEKQLYTLTVLAKGDGNSLPTDPIDARNLAMANTLKYENSVLSWSHVIGAAFYDVQVNDEPAFSVSDGSNFADIALTKAGENTLKVRFVDETGSAYEWVSTSVYAHTLTFVSDGGYSVEEQYKAVGDAISLPTPQKKGYDFLNWYNTPKGPESNGAAFSDTTFKASGDLMLYACYTPKQYTLTYHYGEGGNGVEVDGNVFYQKDYQLTVPQANDATSAFGGWFSAPNGNGIQYTDDKGNSLNPWNRTENGDVYAFWFDDVLSFTLTSNAGKPIYSVMQGSRISQVSEVTIPATYRGIKVGMLSGNAFKDCSNLVTINIPNTVEVISSVDPFTGCTSLTAVNVYEVEDNGNIRYWSSDGVLFDNGRLDQQPSDPSQIRSQLSFMPLGKTGSYTIPDGIVEIPSLAFANCALSRVVIPSSVTVIGVEAFKGSEQLTTIVFDTGSTQALTIADGAFADCESLVSVTLPARLTSIALTKYELLSPSGSPASQTVSLETGVTNAFVGCKNLENIYIADGNKTYKSVDGVLYSADSSTLLYALPSVSDDPETEKFEIPEGVTTIANGAFIGSDVENIVIPSTVTMVGECAFFDTNVRSVTFKGNGFNDVTIGKYAFRNCGYLTKVTFEDGNRVSVIGEGAFYGCDDYDFSSITLPKNLKSLGAQAFRDCEYLEEIVVQASDSNLTFGSDVFYNCESLTTLSLPKNVTELPGVFSGCTSLEEVIVDPENEHFTSVDGVLYDKAQTTILFYPQSKSDTSFVLPETLTTISDGVFRGNRNLQSVTIGKNVSLIGVGAFQDCGYLSEIIFAEGDNGASALEIGAHAFDGIDASTITLPARTNKVGEYAFANLGSLESITLNEGLEEISEGMLYDAKSLTSLVIPASVKVIGAKAFAMGGSSWWPSQSSLTSLTFAEGSQLVSIGAEAFLYATDKYASEPISIVLPQGLQSIGYQAFNGANFAQITIPNTVKYIAGQAFAESKLTSVIFADGGTEDLVLGTEDPNHTDYWGELIGNVFEGCDYLESIALPSRLVYLGNQTFYDCGSLTTVTFGENSRLKHIGTEAFYGTSVQNLTIPKSVSNGDVVVNESGATKFHLGVAKKAFYGMTSLEVLSFEEGGSEPLSFGKGAFEYTSALTTLNLPARLCDYTDENGETVKGISASTFEQSSSTLLVNINVEEGGQHYCSVNGVLYSADKKVLVVCPAGRAEKVTIEATVEEIAEQAFAYSQATEIEFASYGAQGCNDMVIGKEAFKWCSALTQIELPDNVVEIREGAFSNCKALEIITLPAKLKDFNSNIFSGTNIRLINVSASNPDYSSQDGVVFNKDMTKLLLYPSTLEAEMYTVPAGVTEIGDSAFNGNTNLKTIVLPAGLTKIGALAFNGCSNLSNVAFPSSLEMIGERAFGSCSKLGDVTFENGGTGLLVIEEYAFQYSGITSVEFPSTLSTIGSSAFYNCSKLESATFADGCKLNSLGNSAFNSCSSLKTVNFQEGLTAVGNEAFANCSALTTVTFSEGLLEMGEEAFANCSSLERVSLSASLMTMGMNVFAECSSLKSVAFAPGAQLAFIPQGTFYNCTSLERFTIPASVEYIEDCLYDSDYSRPESGHYGAFQGCSNLKAVTFEEGGKCKNIGNYAFYGCAKLEAFTIPNSVSHLGISAFQNCESLTEIVIPSTATIYGANLFNGCRSLERVVLNEKATALSKGMFENCTSLKHLDIPASVTSFGDSLLDGTGIETFVVPEYVTVLPDYFFARCKSLVEVTLPSGLKSIGRYAFVECTALKTIDIPDNVTLIKDSAFSECSALASIKLPANLETIEESAFELCTSLTSITIPAKVKLIERRAFSDCIKLVEVYNNSELEIVAGSSDHGYVAYYAEAVLKAGDESVITTTDDGFVLFISGTDVKVLSYNGNATDLVLPANATAIFEYAFANSNIKSVTIPASITTISNYAFSNCANLQTVVIQGEVDTIGVGAFENCVKLTSINIPDSVATIDDDAFYGCSALVNITLPVNLTTLGANAFRDCTSLESIVIPNGITDLDGTFRGCTNLRTVTLPTALSYLDEAFVGCTLLEAFAMDEDGTSYKVVDGVLFSADGTELLAVPAMKTGTFIVPKEVTSIDSEAFVGSHLDLLMFEGGRSEKFDLYSSSSYGSAAWLRNATVKGVVISLESFESLNYYIFNYWSNEQTIYFVESREEVVANLSSFDPDDVSIPVVYNYQVPQEETPQA